MPIYEFYCADCHTIYAFLSKAVDTTKRPDCPRCGRAKLERRASAFAISKARPEPSGTDEIPEGLDEARLERAMESLAGDAQALDSEDPRAAARLMRRLYDTAGLALPASLEEAMRRLESGEDPDAIEEELGDALGDADPLASPAAVAGSRLRRRFLPPRKDPELHEM